MMVTTEPTVFPLCLRCAEPALRAWKGWPHRDAIPVLPCLEAGTCPNCGGTEELQSSRVTWFNYHREYSTGLPDYWLLVPDGKRVKWGRPYYSEGRCPKCG